MRWLRAKLQCADHAADLAHDTFVRLLTAPPEGRHTLREPRAYLTTVAQRLLIDHYRRLSLEQAWLETLAQQPVSPFHSEHEHLTQRRGDQRSAPMRGRAGLALRVAQASGDPLVAPSKCLCRH